MRMRSFNYMIICLSCILNWFALAYKPIGTLFSKKELKKNSMIRVISGLIQSVSSTSLVTFNRKEFSLNMVAVSNFQLFFVLKFHRDIIEN